MKHAILEYLPHAYRQALLVLSENIQGKTDRQKRSQWQILASSALAGTAGAVPVPWIDIPVVLALQTHLAMRIAKIYNQEISPSDWAILSSATGSRIAMRMALTEALKFIPYWGMAAGAASSFAFTYALGMSWDWYFANMRGGNVPDVDRLREVFQEQLKRVISCGAPSEPCPLHLAAYIGDDPALALAFVALHRHRHRRALPNRLATFHGVVATVVVASCLVGGTFLATTETIP